MSETQHPEDIYSQIEFAQPGREVQPVYLLADSQLLFWRDEDGQLFMEGVRQRLRSPQPRAAYVGAANGDDPSFYAIFESAMEQVGIEECRMIPSELDAADLEFVDGAHLILLAGGDVALGWKTFKENGLARILQRRYQEGALLMGVSAGAVHLGLGGWGEGGSQGGKLVETLRVLPHVVGAHEENEGWEPLKAALRRLGEHVRGYGLPAGGGMVYYPDHTIEPLRRPLNEFSLRGRQISQTLLLPGEVEELPEAETPPVENVPLRRVQAEEDEDGEVLVIN